MATLPYLARAHTQAGADRLLLNKYNGQVSVHSTEQAIDSVTSNSDLQSHILRTIAPNTDSVALEAYKLVLSTGALSGNSIKLTLCRYEDDESECAVGDNAPPPSPPAQAAACQDTSTDCPYWKDLRYCEPSSIYAS